jgi:hypothetical protein
MTHLLAVALAARAGHGAGRRPGRTLSLTPSPVRPQRGTAPACARRAVHACRSGTHTVAVVQRSGRTRLNAFLVDWSCGHELTIA